MRSKQGSQVQHLQIKDPESGWELEAWLQQWFQIHCDEDWEHGNGICLETIDNPGWLLTISLEDTELDDRGFQAVKIERTENDWVFYAARNNKFEGACGPTNLPEVLALFRNWAENSQKHDTDLHPHKLVQTGLEVRI